MASGVYKLKSEVIVYPGASGWRFFVLPRETSKKIKEKFGTHVRGWGSLRVTVKLGKTQWETSIFPDKRSETYLLPLKAKVRKVENISDDSVVNFGITIKV